MTRNTFPYCVTPRYRKPQRTNDIRHSPKNAGRRPMPAPKIPPNRHPVTAPRPERSCACALASCIVPPVNWSAQSGSHCTEAHVPISAMEAKEIARRVFFTRPALKISLIGVAAPFFTDAFHRSDSGTNSWIRKVSNAGAAPASITQRHEVWVTLKYLPNTAINPKPTFDEDPITPANMGRFPRGHDSIPRA